MRQDMNFIAQLVSSDLAELGFTDIPYYLDAFAAACEAEPPPYGEKEYGDIFRESALDPHWMAQTLARAAEGEGDGARRLWSLAACTPDKSVADQVKQHAIDESRHSRWYVAMLDIVFPNAVAESDRHILESFSPGYSNDMLPEAIDGSPFAHAITLDELIQMNIAEIRTCVVHRLQTPVLLNYCEPERRTRLQPLLSSLLHDEKKHVGYTARLIDSYARNGHHDEVRELSIARMRDFNQITLQDTEQRVFEST